MNEWTSQPEEMPLQSIKLNQQLKYTKKGVIPVAISETPEVKMPKTGFIIVWAAEASTIRR